MRFFPQTQTVIFPIRILTPPVEQIRPPPCRIQHLHNNQKTPPRHYMITTRPFSPGLQQLAHCLVREISQSRVGVGPVAGNENIRPPPPTPRATRGRRKRAPPRDVLFDLGVAATEHHQPGHPHGGSGGAGERRENSPEKTGFRFSAGTDLLQRAVPGLEQFALRGKVQSAADEPSAVCGVGAVLEVFFPNTNQLFGFSLSVAGGTS